MTKWSGDAYCVAYLTPEDTCSQMHCWIVFSIDSVLGVLQSWVEQPQNCLSLVYTRIQHMSESQRKWNIVVCAWSCRKTAFMTRFDVGHSIFIDRESLKTITTMRDALSWTRPCLSRKTDAIVHHDRSHRRYSDEASSCGASRIFPNFELTSKFEVEVRRSRFEIILIKKNTIQKKEKKKKASTRREGDEDKKGTNFQSRKWTLEVEAWSLKIEIGSLKSKKIQITKNKFDPSPLDSRHCLPPLKFGDAR